MYHLAENHVDIGTNDTLPKIPGKLLVDRRKANGNRHGFDCGVYGGKSDSRYRCNTRATSGAEEQNRRVNSIQV